MNTSARSEHPQVSPAKSSSGLLETEPSAARIVDAIAAFPYTALTATMDIVDNSVENGATGVSVTFERADKAIKRILFADNGTGVAHEHIDEVLRAGSRTQHLYKATSLSRFGVGLKGAGFALANRIVVFTRNGDGTINRRAIDRTHIEKTDRWEQEVRPPTPTEIAFYEETLSALPGDGPVETGTVVVLEDVKLQTRDLPKLRGELARNAGETYNKFLAGGTGGSLRRLAITVDGKAVEGVDPLHREDPNTVALIKREKVDFEDGTSAFFTAVSLPHPNTLPDEVSRSYRYHQKYQGIYVYRNGRLVSSGATLDLFSRDFHLNAFRAELEYDTTADSHFPVDVAKSTINIDEDAAKKLDPLVGGAVKTANALWRQKDILSKDDIKDLFEEANRSIGARANLLVDLVKRRKTERIAPHAAPTTPTGVPPSLLPPKPLRPPETGYLRAVDSLPDGMLYRPLLDADFGIVVEVSLSHVFAKAVFEVSPGEFKPGDAKRSVPRRATTAAQQLLYALGHAEYGMGGDFDDEKQRRMFEQFRRFVSMNLSALLD
jgi:hypothetical protein